VLPHYPWLARLHRLAPTTGAADRPDV